VVRPGEAFKDVALEPLTVPGVPHQLPSLRGQHVLVVDDDGELREYLRQHLEQAGANVTLAASAASGLRALKEHPVTVLISDIEMPITNGLELIKLVRRTMSHAHLPAIAVSAHMRPDDAKAAVDAGFDLHVGKPVDVAQLVTAIDALAAIRGQAEMER
jgi:CheY-like chemotaxis protein